MIYTCKNVYLASVDVMFGLKLIFLASYLLPSVFWRKQRPYEKHKFLLVKIQLKPYLHIAQSNISLACLYWKIHFQKAQGCSMQRELCSSKEHLSLAQNWYYRVLLPLRSEAVRSLSCEPFFTRHFQFWWYFRFFTWDKSSSVIFPSWQQRWPRWFGALSNPV